MGTPHEKLAFKSAKSGLKTEVVVSEVFSYMEMRKVRYPRTCSKYRAESWSLVAGRGRGRGGSFI